MTNYPLRPTPRGLSLQALTNSRFGSNLLWGSLLVLKILVIALVIMVVYLVYRVSNRDNEQNKRVDGQLAQMRESLTKFGEAATKQADAATKQADSATKQSENMQRSIDSLSQQSMDQFRKLKAQEDRRYSELKQDLMTQSSEIANLKKRADGTAGPTVSGTLTTGSRQVSSGLKPCNAAIPAAGGTWDIPVSDGKGHISRYVRVVSNAQEVDSRADQILIRVTTADSNAAHYVLTPKCEWRSE